MTQQVIQFSYPVLLSRYLVSYHGTVFFFLIRPSNKLETHYLLLKVTQARYLFS